MYVKKRKWWFNKSRECAIIYIVYTTFCKTFRGDTGNTTVNSQEEGATVGEVILMLGVIFVWVGLLMVLAWYTFKLAYRDQPQLRVFALFGCTQKTISLGVPLIQALYEDNTALALFTLPILIWHPVELILGSLTAPKLRPFTLKEKKRVKLKNMIRSSLDVDQREITLDDISSDGSSEYYMPVTTRRSKTRRSFVGFFGQVGDEMADTIRAMEELDFSDEEEKGATGSREGEATDSSVDETVQRDTQPPSSPFSVTSLEKIDEETRVKAVEECLAVLDVCPLSPAVGDIVTVVDEEGGGGEMAKEKL